MLGEFTKPALSTSSEIKQTKDENREKVVFPHMYDGNKIKENCNQDFRAKWQQTRQQN